MSTITTLVTGSEGAIGRHVVERLVSDGYRVVSVDLVPRTDSATATFRHIQCDLLDHNAAEDLLEQVRPDIVLNLAACLPVAAEENLRKAVDLNAVLAERIAQASVNNGVQLLVHFSSKSVYAGDGPAGYPEYQAVDVENETKPDTNYGISKLTGELLVQRTVRGSDTRAAIFRLGSTFGRGKGPQHGSLDWLSRLVTAADRGENIVLYAEPDSGSDFVYNRDVAHAVSLACAHHEKFPTGSTCLNIGSGTLVSIEEVCRALNDVCGRLVVSRTDDVARADVCVPAVGMLLDISAARTLLGFSPEFDMRAALADFVSTPDHGLS